MDIYRLCMDVAVIEERLLALRKLLSTGNAISGREPRAGDDVDSVAVEAGLGWLKSSVAQLEYDWLTEKRFTQLERSKRERI